MPFSQLPLAQQDEQQNAIHLYCTRLQAGVQGISNLTKESNLTPLFPIFSLYMKERWELLQSINNTYILKLNMQILEPLLLHCGDHSDIQLYGVVFCTDTNW